MYRRGFTLLEIVVALFVGMVELLQLMIGQLRLRGQPWDSIGWLDFSNMEIASRPAPRPGQRALSEPWTYA